MSDILVQAIEDSKPAIALAIFDEEFTKNDDAWDVHLDLFSSAQRVLNPPFINPHLPKMYRIYREFIPYLEDNDVAALVRLEISEFARRSKLKKLPETETPDSEVSFHEIESAIREGEWSETAVLMNAFYTQQGGEEFARRLLLLGSDYLDSSLGHSVSCTAFILLEMLERADHDPWTVIAVLADYFCKGSFHQTPELSGNAAAPSKEELNEHLSRAVSGRGIRNLHHTITLYAIERVHHLFNEAQFDHLVKAWIQFLGNKVTEQVELQKTVREPVDYANFFKTFSVMETVPVMQYARGMIASKEGRHRLGRFLIKGVCELYNGSYNPHNLTGLGSALWTVENWWGRPEIALGALFQYLDYFFHEIRG